MRHQQVYCAHNVLFSHLDSLVVTISTSIDNIMLIFLFCHFKYHALTNIGSIAEWFNHYHIFFYCCPHSSLSTWHNLKSRQRWDAQRTNMECKMNTLNVITHKCILHPKLKKGGTENRTGLKYMNMSEQLCIRISVKKQEICIDV